MRVAVTRKRIIWVAKTSSKALRPAGVQRRAPSLHRCIKPSRSAASMRRCTWLRGDQRRRDDPSGRLHRSAPVDRDRDKLTREFDIVVATATREKGNWIVRKGRVAEDQRGPATYFWVRKNDRATWYAPTRRKRDHLIEGRSPIMTIITRAMLGDEAKKYEPRSAKAGSLSMAV